MNTTANTTVVEFLEKNVTEMEETLTLEEQIATLAMDSADCWF